MRYRLFCCVKVLKLSKVENLKPEGNKESG